jgi:transmembrane sensor
VAVVAVAAIVVVAALQFRRPDARIYVTGVGHHETIALDDGSRIVMNTDTVLRVASSGTSRTVWLDRGEAYFKIKHDAARTFTVLAGDRRVTDLGTEFLMRRDADRLKVAVVLGRVALNGKTGQKPTVLVQGDVALATPGALSMTRDSRVGLANQLGWLQDRLIFKHASIAEAAGEFNRYNEKN